MSIPAEDVVLAEGVLEAVESHQAGKAIQKAERITRQHLLQDPDDTVRTRAVDALGSASSRDLGRLRPLMAALGDRRWLVRGRAATALATLLGRATTGAGFEGTVAPSADLVSDALAALGLALEEATTEAASGGGSAFEASQAARPLCEATVVLRNLAS